MSRNATASRPPEDQLPVSAAESFSGGQRVWYDPQSALVLTEQEAIKALAP